MLPEKFSAILQAVSFNAVPAGGERMRKIATITLRVTTEQLGPLPTHDLDAVIEACSDGLADRVQIGQTATQITVRIKSDDTPKGSPFEAKVAEVRRLVLKRADDENGDPVVWVSVNLSCEISTVQASPLVGMLRHGVTVETSPRQTELEMAEPEQPKRRAPAPSASN